MKIIDYKTKSGNKRYEFSLYAGKDSSTGRTIMVRKKGFKSLKDAREGYLKLQLAIDNGEYKPINERRFKLSEIVEMWLKVYQPTVKESTFATTLRMVNDHVVKDLGNIYLDKLSVLQCQKAVNKWFKQAPKTYKKYVRYANKAIDYAIHLEIVSKNPMKNIVRPKVKNEHKEFTNFYTKEELNSFLMWARVYDQKAFTMFRLLAYTGLRRGEALALKWSDIDFKNKIISVRRTLSRGLDNRSIIQTPKTNSSFREVVIDDMTLDILQQWQKKQREQLVVINIDQNQFVFTRGMSNKPMSENTPIRWNEAICKLGHLRKISVHGFRHTNASLLFEAGVSMKDVQTRLGHKSIKTTMDVYTHVSKRRQNKAVEQLSNYMNG